MRIIPTPKWFGKSPTTSTSVYTQATAGGPSQEFPNHFRLSIMRLILIEYDLDIEANEESKYEFVMKIASGQLGYEGIKVWIHENLMNKK